MRGHELAKDHEAINRIKEEEQKQREELWFTLIYKKGHLVAFYLRMRYFDLI